MSDARPPSSKTPEWISCQELIDHLLEYVEDALTIETRDKLERHFKLCPPCREFLRQYRALPAICERALNQSMPADSAERLSAFLKARTEDDPDSQ